MVQLKLLYLKPHVTWNRCLPWSGGRNPAVLGTIVKLNAGYSVTDSPISERRGPRVVFCSSCSEVNQNLCARCVPKARQLVAAQICSPERTCKSLISREADWDVLALWTRRPVGTDLRPIWVLSGEARHVRLFTFGPRLYRGIKKTFSSSASYGVALAGTFPLKARR